MKMKKFIISVFVFTLVLMAFVLPLRADYSSSYTIDSLSDGIGYISDIVLMEQNAVGDLQSTSFPYQAGQNDTIGSSQLPFQPSTSLLVGVVTDSIDHAVIFMNTGISDLFSESLFNSASTSWDSYFGTSEQDMITSIKDLTGGATTDVSNVLGFATSQSVTQLSNGYSSLNAWFTTGTSFSLTQWSDGTVIGHGTSSYREIPSTEVPEPTSILLLGLGLVGLAGVRKRIGI